MEFGRSSVGRPWSSLPAKSTPRPSHPVVWAQTALFHNTLPDTHISLLSFMPPFLVLQPRSSVYLCDFGCALYLFRVCFSHRAAMFALLMILFPTSGTVSCIQQMLKMFLWIMNEFSIHIPPETPTILQYVCFCSLAPTYSSLNTYMRFMIHYNLASHLSLLPSLGSLFSRFFFFYYVSFQCISIMAQQVSLTHLLAYICNNNNLKNKKPRHWKGAEET